MFQTQDLENLEELSENELKKVVGGRTLQDDLNEFLDLIPSAQIKANFLNYLTSDIELT